MISYRNIRDLSGCRFNRLVVIRQARPDECTSRQLELNDTKWVCRCDCNPDQTIIVLRGNLTTGHTGSCGCSKVGQFRPGNKGVSEGVKRIHNIWWSMKARCYHQPSYGYKHYGARGIGICEEWKDNFDAFREWSLSHGYQDDLTIDRIDVNTDYSPTNCRWITNLEQQSNKTNSITCASGLSLRAECAKRGLNYNTVRMRYKNGYTLEEALNIGPISNKLYFGGKTMEEWCTEIKINVNKVKTRMCRHKESFQMSLMHYAVKANNQQLIDFITNFIPVARDPDRDYSRPRKQDNEELVVPEPSKSYW